MGNITFNFVTKNIYLMLIINEPEINYFYSSPFEFSMDVIISKLY